MFGAVCCWLAFLQRTASAAAVHVGFPWADLFQATLWFGAGYGLLATAIRYRRGGALERPGLLRWLGLVALLSTTAVFVALVTFSMRADAARSSRVQRSGLRVAAVVEAVHVNTRTSVSESSGERTRITSVDARVRYVDPVQGVDTTTVRRQGLWVVKKGDQLRLLVDPADPAYAEPEGAPLARSRTWLAVLLCGLGAWVALVIATWRGAGGPRSADNGEDERSS